MKKWAAAPGSERAVAQSHMNDICHLLGEPTPTDGRPDGKRFAFEQGASKTSGGNGFADVWLEGNFAWEYKKRRAKLDDAYKQVINYHEALGNPPLLVVCDLNRFEIHTNFPTSRTKWTARRYHSTLS